MLTVRHQRVVTEVDGLRDHREESLGHLHRLARIVEVGEHGGELVAAEAGDAVGRPQRLLQPLPDHLQQPVADVVAEVVVDGLEAVEVEVQHREVRLVTADARQRGLEPVEQQHAVREAGERVVQRVGG